MLVACIHIFDGKNNVYPENIYSSMHFLHFILFVYFSTPHAHYSKLFSKIFMWTWLSKWDVKNSEAAVQGCSSEKFALFTGEQLSRSFSLIKLWVFSLPYQKRDSGRSNLLWNFEKIFRAAFLQSTLHAAIFRNLQI